MHDLLERFAVQMEKPSEKDGLFVFVISLSLLADHHPDQVVGPVSDAREREHEKYNRRADKQLEPPISLFVGRRQLVLRKVWRWSIHTVTLSI